MFVDLCMQNACAANDCLYKYAASGNHCNKKYNDYCYMINN